jgi:PAS domain S-box-containing protein
VRKTPISALSEEALRVRELQLSEAQAVADIGSWEWDLKRQRVTWSDHMYRICGVERESPASAELFFQLIHPEDRERCIAAAERQRTDGTGYEEPFRIVRPDGAVRWFQGRSHTDVDEAGRPVRIVGICQDITERVDSAQTLSKYAEQLLAVSRRLVDVQETERRQLASELHDRVGPNLTALGINLCLVEESLPDEVRRLVRTTLKDSRRMVEETVSVIRDVMAELRPQTLDDYGLVAALRTLASAFSRRTGIPVSVRAAEAPGRTTQPADLALLRIAQEALNNVAKHARAARVEIHYEESAGAARLEIQDDGCGLDPARVESRGGWGLLIMRERADSVGASFEIDSAAGRGVRVRVEIG